MIELRDYQSVFVDGSREKLRRRVRRLLNVSPTGSGKTVMAGFMQGNAAQKGLITWFVVHRIEIVLRTAETFGDLGIDYGIVADGYPLQAEKPVQICSVDTLVSRMHLLPTPDGIIFDEAHHIVAGSHSMIANTAETAWHIGFTATPERTDGRGLGEFFQEMVIGPGDRDLIDRGYLSPYRYYAPGDPDLGAGRQGLNRRDATEIMGDAKLIGHAIDVWSKDAFGWPTIGFEMSRRASMETVAAFKASGVVAEHVDGSMHRDRRKELFAAFRSGEITYLSQVAVAGEGVDIPGAACALLRYQTNSLTKWKQDVGRVFRSVYADGFDQNGATDEGRLDAIARGPKPYSLILDLGGNAFQFGMPCDERKWSLEGAKTRRKSEKVNDAIPIRQCPTCYRIAPSTVKVCPGCEREHATVWTPPKAAAGDLFELKRQGETDKEAAKKAAQAQRKAEERACGSDLAAWIRLGVTRKYTNPRGWALNQIKIRGDYAARFKRRA